MGNISHASSIPVCDERGLSEERVGLPQKAAPGNVFRWTTRFG